VKRFSQYLEVYRIMLRNSLVREMNFKLNFILWLFTDALWFVGQLIFIEVIYAQVDEIGDWNKWDMVLLVGTYQIISQVFQGFFYLNLTNLSELVRTGKLDFVLLQPIDPQFTVSLRQFGVDGIVNALIGIVIVCYSLVQLHIVPSVGQILLYVVALGFGISVHYAAMLAFATVSFWTVRTQGITYGYYSLISLARYPDSMFKGLAKFVFSWVIPIMVVTNVPARLLIHETSSPWPLLGHLAAASIFMIVASRLLWRTALNRYSSASS
jgi:viologen exporter family transport system permease protein